MCNKCAPFDGLWMETPQGLRRCDCETGRRLKEASDAAVNPQYHPPVISAKDAEVFVEMLAAIPYFPRESGARLIIAEELRSICRDSGEALWLAQRMVRLYERWPGPREMRIVYCAKHVPLDGLLEAGLSEVYPDGIPAERPGASQKALEAPAAAEELSAAPSLRNAILDLARAKDMNRSGPPEPVREIPSLPPGVKPVTQADIERAVQELRDRKAREALGEKADAEVR